MTDRDQHGFQKNYFDKEAEEYTYGELYSNWRLSYIERLKRYLKIGETGEKCKCLNYLDIGAGFTGYTVILLSHYYNLCVGLDISDASVRRAHSYTCDLEAKNASLLVGVGEHLPFSNASFNYVVIIGVLEHIDDDKAVASEIARITAPGGLVVITVPNSYKQIPRVLHGPYRYIDEDIGHVRHYSKESLQNLFEDTGFELELIEYSAHAMCKIPQVFLARLFRGSRKGLPQKLWYYFEQLDRRMTDRKSGLQLHMVFRRKA